MKKVESPQHFEGAGQRGDKFFTKNAQLQDTSLRETFKSKSPLRGIVSSRYSKKEVHIKNHKKCIEIMSMVIEVANYFSP